MIISTQTAIDNKWVIIPEGLDIAKHVQPNGLDFTVDKLFVADGNDEFVLSESVRKHKFHTPVSAGEVYVDGQAGSYFNLEPKRSYDVYSDFYVELPEGVCAGLIIRSSLNRNGMFVTSGLFDSGFKGNIGCYMHNLASTNAYIAPGTRVGQIYFYESGKGGVYAGHYNRSGGQHWSESTGPK